MPNIVAPVTITLVSGVQYPYLSTVYVTMSCASTGADIWYVIVVSGTSPNTGVNPDPASNSSSTLYTGPFPVVASGTKYITANAYVTGWTPATLARSHVVGYGFENAPITGGLVMYLSAEKTASIVPPTGGLLTASVSATGAITWNDLSGLANNATFPSGYSFGGNLDTGYYFLCGGNQFATASNTQTLNMTGSWTAAVWVSRSVLQGGSAFGPLIEKFDFSVAPSGGGYALRFDPSDKISARVLSGTSSLTVLGTSVVPTATWHYVAAVFQSNPSGTLANNGGNGLTTSYFLGGGGGGAGSAGASAINSGSSGIDSPPGSGGSGIQNSITGIPIWYAAGGGGSRRDMYTSSLAGQAASGIGGLGGDAGTGTINAIGYGGGGGAGRDPSGFGVGGNGAPGVVVVRYSASSPIVSQAVYDSAPDRVIHTFATTGSATFTPTTDMVVVVTALGAGGASGGGYRSGSWWFTGRGGSGAYVKATMTLSGGVTYNIMVGGGGVVTAALGTVIAGGGGLPTNNNTGNVYAGSGGGYTGIFSGTITQSNALLIAGGGGGGGDSRAGYGNVGGDGGYPAGTRGAAPYDGQPNAGGLPGTTASAGGDSTSTSPSATGNQGPLQGGWPRTNSYGGGGGGGYFGGAGGGYFEPNTMGGGGGGSSYIAPGVTSATFRTGGANNWGRGGGATAPTGGGNGLLRIEYTGSQNGTGGTVTTASGYIVHVFTGSDTFVPNTSTVVDILVVAGGGGGGGGYQGGGGGAGGYLYLTGIAVTSGTSYDVMVGSGGLGITGTNGGTPGGESHFDTYRQLGGGRGAFEWNNGSGQTVGSGSDGGSGGGAAHGPGDTLIGYGGSGGILRVYVDGVRQGTGASTFVTTTGTYALRIGREGYPSGTTTFNGDIAVVHLYGRDLSDSEIFQNYAAASGLFLTPVFPTYLAIPYVTQILSSSTALTNYSHRPYERITSLDISGSSSAPPVRRSKVNKGTN